MGRTRVQPTNVRFVCGLSGYFHKDLAAVKSSPHFDPLAVDGAPVTPGFTSVHLPFLRAVAGPWLLRRDVSVFRANAIAVDALGGSGGCGRRLHTAVRYGLTQALLSATALVWRCTAAEVIAREWAVEMSARPVDILASCHCNDWLQLDRMIMKRVALLPHASFVHVRDIGPEGDYLLEYVRSVSRRIQERGASDYHPRLHFDVYGRLGEAFADAEIPSFMELVARAAHPYGPVLIESPIVASSREAQIQRPRQLKQPACPSHRRPDRRRRVVQHS
ncbi:methylaspartate ammonia-lyase [Cordyceps fumosorosea ARSEF 2679]|uniref:Methylaspartate ammonia-lyase n=1 Tax=Cordyceps fumosorosea (strain ARSEF 2679) TaxID=1081104 RepID=A0A167XIP9_CORFA|nr:methylaspartate ammonia-lyase [Cordyceps fumosorosea ARSEF 2679]OAA65019.1 methylaspartate ammonia-lyase [Cordyceps fumosorosea ARSEF 2679]